MSVSASSSRPSSAASSPRCSTSSSIASSISSQAPLPSFARKPSPADLELFVAARQGINRVITPREFADEVAANVALVSASNPDVADEDFSIENLMTRHASSIIAERIEQCIESDVNVDDADLPLETALEAPYKKLREERYLEREYYRVKGTKKKRMHNCISSAQLRNIIKHKTNKYGIDNMKPGTEVLLKVLFIGFDGYTPEQELLLLSSQMLSDLHDHLLCRVRELAPMLSNHFPASSFCIENCFYDDARSKDADTISQPIIEWSNTGSRHMHPGLTRFHRGLPMHRMCLLNLPFRVGAIYSLTHLGGCVHKLLITDMRILCSSDELNRRVYPLTTGLHRRNRKMCGVCNRVLAQFVTYGDRMAPSNPFFYCSKCYHAFHYNRQGNILYEDFRVFPYHYD